MSTTRTVLSRLLPLALLPLATGCAQLGEFLPKVTFDSLQFRDLTFENADVDFVFKVSNPNAAVTCSCGESFAA